MFRSNFKSLVCSLFCFALSSSVFAQVVPFDPAVCTPLPTEVTPIRTIQIVSIDPVDRARYLPIRIDTNRPSPALAVITYQDGSTRTSQVNASVMELIGRNRFEIRYHFDFPPTPGMGLQSAISLGNSNDPAFDLEGTFSTWRTGAYPPRPVQIHCRDITPPPMPGPGMGGHNP